MLHLGSLLTTLALLTAGFGAGSSLFAQGPPPRQEYRSSSGTEVVWERDLTRALERAQQEQRPVFWYVPTALNTPMDRRQELHWLQRGGIYSDPAVIELLNTRFVPLELGFTTLLDRGDGDSGPAIVEREQRRALAEKYGLIAPAFIEPGFLLLDASGALVHTCDRLGIHENRWFASFLARIFEAHHAPLFGAATVPELRPLHAVLAPELESAIRTLHAGKPAEAAELFANAKQDSAAQYFQGVCAHLLDRATEGDAFWRQLAAAERMDTWSSKAQLELDRWGPFLLGYERYSALPATAFDGNELRTTANGATAELGPSLVLPALEFLIEMPRSRRLYRDSRYDFGGLDSLPNVHVAISALAALALLEWRDLDAARIDPLLDILRTALSDESEIAATDVDEIVWAHACRALFFARSMELEPKQAGAAKQKLKEIVKLLADLQLEGGGWRHEYPAAFTTAFTLYALERAAKHGVHLPPKQLAAAGDALLKVRGENGAWPYGFGKPPRQVEGSACRAPWCELGLFVTERSSKKRLEEALAMAFQHHAALAAVRRYDDHADRLGHGGFFFWFDQLGRAACATKLDASARTRYLGELNAQIAAMREVDGTWMDSPEVGKVYSTAAALICLAASKR